MRIERLAVSGFRRFANGFEFQPDPRFTVIHAPNGTGKSTLLDALYYGLLERHTVTGREAESRFLSMGRRLTPKITIDFAVHQTRYQISKAFFGGKSAMLKRFEGGRYVAEADNSQADDFVRELLCAEIAGRGAIDCGKHLGLAHVLWSAARANFDELPAKAGETIRGMLSSAAAVSDGERDVEERVKQAYLQYYTPNGNYASAAGTANIPSLEKRLNEAQSHAVEARTQYLRLEQLSNDSAARKAEAERMAARRSELREEIVATRLALTQYIALRTDLERSASTESTALEAYEKITGTIASIATLSTELAELTHACSETSGKLELSTIFASKMHDQIAELRAVAENAHAERANILQGANDVTAAEAYVRALETVARLDEQLSEYDASQAKLTELRADAAAIVAPTPADLEIIRKAASDLEKHQASIAASALSLEFAAIADITVEVLEGEKTGPLTIAAGTCVAVTAADASVVVEVPGVGRIRARGTDGAKKARKDAQPLVTFLETVKDRYGPVSVIELAARTEQAAQLARDIVATERQTSGRLGDRSIDDVRAEHAEARGRITSMERTHSAWHVERPNAAELRAAFDLNLQLTSDASNAAQQALRGVEESKREVDAQVTSLRLRETELKMTFGNTMTQLEQLRGDGLDDFSRSAQQGTLALQYRGARAHRESLTDQISRFSEDPADTLARLEASEHGAGTDYDSALEASTRYRTQLETQTNLGNYARLATAEELVSQRAAEHIDALKKAAAIKCLREAFEDVHAKRVASIIEPVTISSTRYFHRIAGSAFGRIEIGEGLAPRGLLANASNTMLPIDGTLSTGEKEQIFLATRLALAEIIATKSGHRQLFVVDDALTATDPYRLRRLIGILEELSRDHLQVIVATADKSRYHGISGAKHIDLAAMLETESAA